MSAAPIVAPAPAGVVDADGRPRIGAYLGHCQNVAWDGLRDVSAWYRRLHAKRWHYVSIVSERVIVAAAIIDAGLVSSTFAYVFDRSRRALLVEHAENALPGRASFSPSPGEGASSRFAGRKTEVCIRRGAGSTRWRIECTAPGLALEATLESAGAPPTLCAVAPIEGGIANATHKTVGLAATGTVKTADGEIALAGGWASLDHTSGLLARDTRWRWASATSGSRGLNLVEGFNGPLENVVWDGATVHPVGPVRFELGSPGLGPWYVRSLDGRLELEFTPEGERRKDQDFILVRSAYVQPFGTFRGRYQAPDGRVVPLDGLIGVTEDHIARW